MALNLKNAEVERLAAELSRLTGESKTETIRRALEERRRRLKTTSVEARRARVLDFLEKRVWPSLPAKQRGKRLTRAQEDDLLGVRPRRRMTIDSSALIAILFSEPGYLDLVDQILNADHPRVAAPTLVESGMVLAGRRKKPLAGEIEGLIAELGITVVPFGEKEAHAALDAFRRFGRGRHRAALNFGDCIAYASAKVAGDSLLFVGDDFARTDIKRA